MHLALLHRFARLQRLHDAYARRSATRAAIHVHAVETSQFRTYIEVERYIILVAG